MHIAERLDLSVARYWSNLDPPEMDGIIELVLQNVGSNRNVGGESFPVMDRCLDYLMLALKKSPDEAREIQRLFEQKRLDPKKLLRPPVAQLRILHRLFTRLWQLKGTEAVEKFYPDWRRKWYLFLRGVVPEERLEEEFRRAFRRWKEIKLALKCRDFRRVGLCLYIS